MRKRSILMIGLLVIVLVVSGCKQPTASSTQTTAPTAAKTDQYPYPMTKPPTPASSYPNPSGSTPVASNPLPTNTADVTMGSISGKLLLNGAPVKNVTLDLAEVLKDANGADLIAGLDRVTAPNTTTDETGAFTFINVKPGKYALILDVIINQYLLSYPGKEESILVTVEAGKNSDVGVFDFDELPIK